MSKLRIGILGAARITPKALIDPARVMPSLELAGVAARDRSKAETFAAAHGIERVFDDYAALIRDPGIDLIYNPLPINLHAAWTIEALHAGKHVLCEKPFAMNADEARAMQAAAARSGKRVIEAFHYRYHPALQSCLDWLRAGLIGKVEHIDALFNVAIKDNGDEIRHRVETGGGAMMDLGCYSLSWALTLMDAAPTRIDASASLTPAGVDESMTAQLVFPSGATAGLTCSMAAGEAFRASLTIRGTKGLIEFTNPIAPHLGAELKMTIGGVSETTPISPISTYTYQLAAVSAGLKAGIALPTEGASIMRQQEALDAVYAAAGLQHLRRP